MAYMSEDEAGRPGPPRKLDLVTWGDSGTSHQPLRYLVHPDPTPFGTTPPNPTQRYSKEPRVGGVGVGSPISPLKTIKVVLSWLLGTVEEAEAPSSKSPF